MGRGYTSKRFKEIVSNIREKLPDAAITADVIVGFPGETDEQFQQRPPAKWRRPGGAAALALASWGARSRRVAACPTPSAWAAAPRTEVQRSTGSAGRLRRRS